MDFLISVPIHDSLLKDSDIKFIRNKNERLKKKHNLYNIGEEQKKEVVLRVKLSEKNNVSVIAIMRMDEHRDF